MSDTGLKLVSMATVIASIATSDPELFETTIKFYEDFGFQLVSDHNPQSDIPASLHKAHGCDREVVLVLGSSTHTEASMSVRLSPVAISKLEVIERVARLKAVTGLRDWRAAASIQVFIVEKIPRELVDKISCPKQVSPALGDPMSLQVLDPLGNVIGFTIVNNPISGLPTEIETPNMGPLLEEIRSAKTGASDTPLPTELVSALATPTDRSKANLADGAARRRIAVLTSGGDAPGMNAAVRAVVRTGIYHECDVFAVYEGYEGLVQGGSYIKQMHWDDVRGWLSIGGTLIGTARCMSFRERAGRLQACHNLIKNGIDGLVVCGGDGSLTGADLFRSDWPDLVGELESTGAITAEQATKHRHLYIAGMVGSIDNDMAMTDNTIGAYSSLDRICQNVDWIEATANSHSRAFVIEVMGRNCGWLALSAAIATHADYVFIPEKPPKNGSWQVQLANTVKRHRAAGRRRSIVIVAEGAIDDDLNPIKCEEVKDVLVDIGLDTRVTTLGHIQRGGPAVAFDRMLATCQGVAAVKAILDATPETPSPMIGIKENQITQVSLLDAVAETKRVADAISRKAFDEARSLRDTEFQEHLSNYIVLSNSDHVNPKFQAETKLNIAIVAVGAPAGGMNAAIASAASYCFARGHKPYAIHNGWSGLARHESIRAITWLESEEMFAQGGCTIGTNRNLPDVDFGMIAYYLGKHSIDGLIIVGGFEAFKSLYMLENARAGYPAFRIPMLCLPATISNNVPGTEYSLGADTCLNALTEYCDVVKQSAASTRHRVFVVEVQGGQSGYVAAYSGLVCGAHVVYTPEEGITLSQLSADIRHLRDCFAKDQGRSRAGRLVIRNEKASPGCTTSNIASIFETESHGKFDAREAVPGHLQQGGQPSPVDRVRAARFSIKCIQFIEEHSQRTNPNFASSETAVVLGVSRSRVITTGCSELWEFSTDVKYRRPTDIHWQSLLDTSNMMALRPVVNLKKEE